MSQGMFQLPHFSIDCRICVSLTVLFRPLFAMNATSHPVGSYHEGLRKLHHLETTSEMAFRMEARPVVGAAHMDQLVHRGGHPTMRKLLVLGHLSSISIISKTWPRCLHIKLQSRPQLRDHQDLALSYLRMERALQRQGQQYQLHHLQHICGTPYINKHKIVLHILHMRHRDIILTDIRMFCTTKNDDCELHSYEDVASDIV